MKVLLCGFMGAGKSYALTKLGALAPEYQKIDLDQWVLDAHNQNSSKKFKTLGELIESLGWEYFRNLESTELLKLLAENSNIFIALGGGSLNSKSQAGLRKYNFHLVWLATPFETCLKRISADPNRPLAKKSQEELRALYEDRVKIYQQAHESINPENFDWASWWHNLSK